MDKYNKYTAKNEPIGKQIRQIIDYEERVIDIENIERSQLSINLRKAAAYLVIIANSNDILTNSDLKSIAVHTYRIIRGVVPPPHVPDDTYSN